MKVEPRTGESGKRRKSFATLGSKSLKAIAILFLAALVVFVWSLGKADRARRAVEKLGGTIETNRFASGPWLNATATLHDIDLSNTGLTDDQLAKLIRHFQNLSKVGPIGYLDLSDTEIGPAGIELLGQVERIRAIEITNAQVTVGEAQAMLGKRPEIHIVDNSGPHAIQHSGCQGLVFSPTGRQLAVLDYNETLIVDTSSGSYKRVSQGGYGVAFSSDDKSLVVGNPKGSTVLNLNSMEIEQTIPWQNQAPTAAVFAENDTTVIVGEGGSSYQYRLADGRLIGSWNSSLLGASRRFPGSSIERQESLFLPGRGEVTLPPLPIPPGAKLTVASADGRFIAWIGNSNLAAPDRGVVFVDAKSGQEIKSVPLPGKKLVMDACFDQKGSRFAIARYDGSVNVLDIESEEWIFHHQDTAGGALHVSLSDDGRLVAAAFEYPSLKWWAIDESNAKPTK